MLARLVPLLCVFTAVACCPRPPVAAPTAPIDRVETPAAPTAAPEGPPVAEERPVTHTYHGVSVVDPYQWLEDPTDSDVRAWSDGQNAAARRVLDALPGRARIEARVRELLAAPIRKHRAIVAAGGKLFALEIRPPREQPFLVVLESADAPDSARILVDPSALDAAGGVAIDWFVPSPDGRLVAVSLSRGGSERGDVHVFDVASGARVHEIIERVNGGTAGGDLAWVRDGSGFYYTRYPRPGERPAADESFFQQVWFHTLGRPVAEDRYELGRDLPRIAEIQLDVHAATGRVLATVQNGDGGQFAIFLRDPRGGWRRLCDFPDGIVQAAFGPRNDLYVISNRDAPRGKVLRVPIAQLDPARATVVVPEGPQAIVTSFFGPSTLLPTRTRLFLTYQTGGPSELRVFDLGGRPQTARFEQPPVSAVRETVFVEGDEILVRVASFVQPSTWYAFDGRTTRATALRESSPVDTSTWEIRREMATSRDGTRVPVNILLRRGTELDGSHPCVVYGYGGYGVSTEPWFDATNAVLLDSGVVYALANIRGGGEFGEAWHLAGALTNKQNVFDDFTAAVQHLIDRRYTSSARLALIGGSNGGLLMGAMMTQHPELAHAVVSYVGIYDMLRVELSPNGEFNTTEFGSVRDEAQFRALYAYSPYHAVRPGTRYPAALLLTGANDPRVEPWHSRKMVARLQAANAADTPILLRTSDTSGHGIGTALSEEIAETADVYAFLFDRLGVSAARP